MSDKTQPSQSVSILMRSRGASNFNEPLAVNVRQQEKQHRGHCQPMLPPPNSPEALNASDLGGLETVYWTPSASFDKVRSVDHNWSGVPWNTETLSSTPKGHRSLLDLGGEDEDLFFSLGERAIPAQEQTESFLFHPTAGIHNIPTIPSFPSVGNIEGNSTAFEEPSFPFLDEDTSFSSTQQVSGDIFVDQLDTPVSTPYSTRKLEALGAGRPGGRLFTDCFGGLHQKDSTPTVLEPSLPVIHSASTIQPFPSSASIVHSKYDSNRQTGNPTVILDESFNDSGLDFPLPESPESWGPRKDDEIHKPGKLRLLRIEETGYERAIPRLARNGPSFHEKMTELPPVSSEWSFEEQIVISLLQQGVLKESRESGDRRMTRRPRRMASASERITKIAKKCWAATFRRW